MRPCVQKVLSSCLFYRSVRKKPRRSKEMKNYLTERSLICFGSMEIFGTLFLGWKAISSFENHFNNSRWKKWEINANSFFFFLFFCFPAKSSRKLTFLYLANDVIQNSKRKGPEFTREFESVLVDAFSHVARYVAVSGISSAFLSRDRCSCCTKLNSVVVFYQISGMLIHSLVEMWFWLL